MIQEKLLHNEKYEAGRSYEIAHLTWWNSRGVEVDEPSCSLILRSNGKYTKHWKLQKRLEHLAYHLGFKTFAVSTKFDTKENTKKENWNKNKSPAYLREFRISPSHSTRPMRWKHNDFFNSCNHSRFSLFLRFRLKNIARLAAIYLESDPLDLPLPPDFPEPPLDFSMYLHMIKVTMKKGCVKIFINHLRASALVLVLVPGVVWARNFSPSWSSCLILAIERVAGSRVVIVPLRLASLRVDVAVSISPVIVIGVIVSLRVGALIGWLWHLESSANENEICLC